MLLVHQRVSIARVVAALLAVAVNASAQQPVNVDVELVLLADASNSIDNAEIQFQRRGYARAITHPDVLSAISKGGFGRIAITFIEWGDESNQEVVVPWMIVKDLASAQSFSRRLHTDR